MKSKKPKLPKERNLDVLGMILTRKAKSWDLRDRRQNRRSRKRTAIEEYT